MDIRKKVTLVAVKEHPAVLPYLKGNALNIALADQYELSEYKTVEFYRRALYGLVRSVYNNLMGGEFRDILQNLVTGQLTQAFQFAIDEAGVDWMPELTRELDRMIASELPFIDPYFRDIVDARIDETPIDPLLARADIWANRWNDAYNKAKSIIAALFGEKLVWQLGMAEHCSTCQRLHGTVAFAKEWNDLGVRPQNPPNGNLECGGWNCKCSLVPTDARRSSNAFSRIAAIVGA